MVSGKTCICISWLFTEVRSECVLSYIHDSLSPFYPDSWSLSYSISRIDGIFPILSFGVLLTFSQPHRRLSLKTFQRPFIVSDFAVLAWRSSFTSCVQPVTLVQGSYRSSQVCDTQTKISLSHYPDFRLEHVQLFYPTILLVEMVFKPFASSLKSVLFREVFFVLCIGFTMYHLSLESLIQPNT